MGYGLLENFKEITEKYDENKDVEFLNGDKFNFINMTQGEFIIFYPNDVHAPMLAVDEKQKIKKVIVKIVEVQPDLNLSSLSHLSVMRKKMTSLIFFSMKKMKNESMKSLKKR